MGGGEWISFDWVKRLQGSRVITLIASTYSGGRNRAPREKLLSSSGGILIRLPSSIASGFGCLFTFSLYIEMSISKLRAGPALACYRLSLKERFIIILPISYFRKESFSLRGDDFSVILSAKPHLRCECLYIRYGKTTSLLCFHLFPRFLAFLSILITAKVTIPFEWKNVKRALGRRTLMSRRFLQVSVPYYSTTP